MAARIERHDWASTPLGPIEHWPARLRAAVDLMLALPQPGYIGWGPTLVSLYNDPYVPVLGSKHPQALGRSYYEIWAELDAGYRAALDATLAGQAQMFVDQAMPLAGRGRDISWFTFSWTPLHDDDGRIAGFLTVGIETTEKMLAQQALQESEARATSLVGALSQATWETGADGLVTVDSPSWRSYTGQTLGESIGWGWLDAVHPDDREYARRQWAEAVATRSLVNAEFRLRHAGGGWRWTNVRAVPLLDANGRVRKWVGMNIDIDARRRAEIARAESDEQRRIGEVRLRAAVEASGIGTWVWYPARDATECDARTYELMGYPPGTPLSVDKAIAERLHPDDAGGYAAAVTAAIQPGGDGVLAHEFRVLFPGSTTRWVLARGRAMFETAGGVATSLVGTIEDISARKRREVDLAFLAEFERRLAFGTDADAIARDAAEVIAEHFASAHCLLVDIDPDAGMAHVGWDCTAPGWPDLRGDYRLADSHTPDELARLASGEPVTLDDVRIACDAARAAEIEGYGVRALATLSCIRDGRWVFAISVQYERPHAWDAGEIALLRRLVDRLWLRIERARTDAARREHEAEQAFLLALADAIRPLSEPQEIQKAVTRLLRERFDAGWCYYAEYDDETHLGTVAFDARRDGLTSLVGTHDVGDAPQFFEAMRRGELLDVPDYAASPLFSPRMAAAYTHLGLRSLLGAPLVKNGRLVAMLLLADTAAHPWPATAQRLVVEVAERTWSAIERARADAGRERALAAIARQTRFIEGMLGSLPDYAYAFDRVHRIAYTNRAMQGLFGRSAEEMAGRTFADLDYPPDLAARLDAQIERVLRTGETVEGEVFYTSPTGVAAYFEYVWGPVFDADGRVELVVGTSRDTTQRHEMEARIRAGEAWQAFLVRLGDVLRDLSDPAAIGREALALLGTQLGLQRVLFGTYEGDDVHVGHEYVDGVASIAGRYPHVAFGTSLKSLLEAGKPIVVDDVAHDPRFDDVARRRYAQADIAALIGLGLHEEGAIVAAFGVHASRPRAWTPDDIALVREVGERTWAALKRATAEARLAESERRLAAIFANAAVGLSEIDPAGRFVRVNGEMCRILGREPGEMIGLRMLDVTREDDVPATIAAVQRARATGGTARLEKRYRRPDGETMWAESSVTPFRTYEGTPGNLLAVTVDIGERKAAESAREESERLLRQFSEASSDVLWIRDATTLRWEYLSPGYELVYGEALEVADAHSEVDHWVNRILPEDRAHAIRLLQRVREGEQVTFEYRIRRASDGAVRWVRDTDFPLFDAEGRVHRIGGIGHDITDVKAAQTELQISEERLRGLIEGIPQLVWRADPSGACTWASPQWMEFTGQAEVDVIGNGWAAVVHPEDVARTLAAVDAARRDGRLDVETRLRRADGAYLWHHVRSAPRLDADGHVTEWLGTCTDVHQLKAMQEQQQVLVAELQHRTRNLIAVVRAIADRTMAGSASMIDFRDRFRDRMAALARVQGLLSQRDGGRRVTFDQLLQAELGGLGVLDRTSQLDLQGPHSVGLRSATVQTFALALHELATNALKYGALATSQGHLHVGWSMDRDADGLPVLCVEWRESGVDIAHERRDVGARRGYGRELIERALPYQLQAETHYEIAPDGVHCSIRVPLAPERADG